MASGSINFGTSNGATTGTLRWWSTVNKQGNYSDVDIQVVLLKNSTISTRGTLNCNLSLSDGQSANNSFSIEISSSTGEVQIFRKTFRVNHENNGQKVILINFNGGVPDTTLSNFSTALYARLDTIPRFTSITEFICTGVTHNKATFKVKTADVCNWCRFYLDGKSTWKDSNTNDSTTYEFTVENLQHSSTHTIVVEVRRKDSGQWTKSNPISFSLNKISEITKYPLSFKITDNPTIEFINRNAINARIIMYDDNKLNTWIEICSVPIASSTTTSVTFNLTEEQRDKIGLVMPNRTNHQIVFNLETKFNNDNTIYDFNKFINVVINDANPKFDSFTCKCYEENTTDILGDYMYLLQDFNTLLIKVDDLRKPVFKYGSKFNKYEISIFDGNIMLYKFDHNEETFILKTNTFDKTSRNFKCSVKVYDTRGFTTTITKSFIVLPYHKPILDVKLTRYNDYEQETLIDLTTLISQVSLTGSDSTKNSYQIMTYSYCEAGLDYNEFKNVEGYVNSKIDMDFKRTLLKQSPETPFVILDKQKSYNFKFIVKDKFTTSELELFVNAGIPILTVFDNGFVGVNRIPNCDITASLQIKDDLLINDTKVLETLINLLPQYIYRVGDLKFTTDNTDPGNYIPNTTWIRWGQGRVPVGVNESDNDFNTVEKTGGEKTHKLSNSEMPKHLHGNEQFGYSEGNSNTRFTLGYGSTRSGNDYIRTSYSGGDQPHNNIQPYITCYIWKRVT